MSRKIVVIGGVAGGASAAARLRRLGEGDQIVMFERGPDVSFSNCSLPYHLSGVVADAGRLIMMTPAKFKAQYNIDARTQSEVIAINRGAKTVTVRNLADGSSYEESYDQLILAPGAVPLQPPIPGRELLPIHTVHKVQDTVALKQALVPGKRVVVIGGGFIGVETAENLADAGCQVALVEALPQILRIFDEDMVQILHKEMVDHGVQLIVNDKVEAFTATEVVLASGQRLAADLVVMAIGVRPETALAKDAGLALGHSGAISVDELCRTTDPDIYAVGDAIEVHSKLFAEPYRLSLAWPAQVQARGVAGHIHGQDFQAPRFIGSSCIKVFDYNAASTGLTEAQLLASSAPVAYEVAHVAPFDRVSLMPDARVCFLKLIFAKADGRILGAQAIGKGEVAKRIDVIATAMHFNATVQDLPQLELCYAPPFSTAKDVVNMAGYVACNLQDGAYRQVRAKDVRALVASNAYILDVREKGELASGVIHGSHNIPMSELRGRVGEIPTDRPLYVHCRTGQRSYNVVLTLQQLGFNQVYNIAGGFLALSFYEYFRDQSEQRPPIVSGYNFN